MKKIINLALIAITLLSVSCDYNNRNFPGYNDTAIKVVKTLEYTMTAEDYKAISNNPVNKKIAKERSVKDSEELAKVGAQQTFNLTISAREYAPAFLATLFPTLDDNSAVKLTYNTIDKLPEYIEMLSSKVGVINLNNNDYDTVFGVASDKNYFETTAQITANMGKILNGRIASPNADTIIFITYNLKPASEIITSAVMWRYERNVWKEYKNNIVYTMQKADFQSMGIKYDNFSGTQADTYLAPFLKQKFPYAQKDDRKVIVYKSFNLGQTNIGAVEYIFDGINWNKNSGSKTKTDQFLRRDGKWMFDPNVTIDLSPIKGDPFISSYYQAAVDWVWENIDLPAGCSTKGQGYVTSFGNNDYYGGMSAFYNNIDMRADKAKEQVSKSTIADIKNAYPADWTEEQVQAKMRENLIKELNGMLQKKHPEATTVEGMEVIYTINLPFYTGKNISQNNYTIRYKVIGQNQFEYIKDSLKPIE